MNENLRAEFEKWCHDYFGRIPRCKSNGEYGLGIWYDRKLAFIAGYQAHHAAVLPVLREVRELIEKGQKSTLYTGQSFLEQALDKLEQLIGDEDGK